ncbi:hypothetical protein [Streptomyces sp. B5E4]|uniref:hypothetical protein n=1 Tax=Streptomyces sp. B5E4 TaxID=3153568 RepID=UPI00325ED9F1
MTEYGLPRPPTDRELSTEGSWEGACPLSAGTAALVAVFFGLAAIWSVRNAVLLA